MIPYSVLVLVSILSQEKEIIRIRIGNIHRCCNCPYQKLKKIQIIITDKRVR